MLTEATGYDIYESSELSLQHVCKYKTIVKLKIYLKMSGLKLPIITLITKVTHNASIRMNPTNTILKEVKDKRRNNV